MKKLTRSRNTTLLLGALLIVEIAGLFIDSAVIEGLSSRADILRKVAVAESDDETILPGNFYDRDGNIIAKTDYRTVIEKTTKGDEYTDSRKITRYADGRAFSQLIGYTGNRSLSLTSDSADEAVGSRNDSRLMAFLDNEYWGDNGLYSTNDIDSTRGQSVTLTIDYDMQMASYRMLGSFMSSSEDMGSVVIMNAKTGEILADVSFPAYDFNNLDEALEQMQEDAETTSLDPGYPVTYKNPIPPGSIFKILTAASLMEHGMKDYTVENTSYTMGEGWTCLSKHYDNGVLKIAEGDEIGIEEALNISSNVYFSKAALALGADKLRETAAKFKIAGDKDYLALDFGNVRYNWDLDVSNAELAQTGFGQGKTEWTTIVAAMVTQAIANKGHLMKPYMVKDLKDADGNIVYEGKPEMLSEAISEENSSSLSSMLRSTAINNGIANGNPEIKEIIDRYQIAGKTGTSENGDSNDTINGWYVSFAPASDPEYVVVINQCRSDTWGYQLLPLATQIYDYLFTHR